MISSPLLVHEKIWLDKPKYDAAERRYYERLAKSSESAKVPNSTIVSDQQDNAGLIEGQDVQASLNNSSFSMSDQMSPTVIQQVKSTKREDALLKEAKIEASSANNDKVKIDNCATKHDLSKVNLNDSVCSKTVLGTPNDEDVSEKYIEMISNSIQQPVIESEVSQIISNHSKSILINKGTGKELSCLPQTCKVDVGSKSEKSKKSDVQSRDNTLPKGDSFANIKMEVVDVACSKGKGQNKSKVADDKGLKQEFVPDKGSCIDPVSDLVKIDDIAVTSNTVSVEITNRLNSLEKENLELKNQVSELVELLKKMDQRISSLEKTSAGGSKFVDNKAPAPVPHPKKDDAEDDDGVDLFGSDSEDEDTEAAKIKEQRLAEYAARKAKKPVLIAKSNIILDVKPWDDETNMKELEAEVRKISTDGLVWGASKLVPLAYGIHKLQISCVVEDDKVSVDWLQETIQEIEDYVQSVDIAAFNKV